MTRQALAKESILVEKTTTEQKKLALISREKSQLLLVTCTAMRVTAVLSSFCHGNGYDNQCRYVERQIIQHDSSKMAELEIDNSDKIVEKVKKFKRETCGCALGLNGRPCSDQFTEETVLYNLNNCLELSSTELDLVILGRVVRKPVNINPGLNVIRRIVFSSLEMFFTSNVWCSLRLLLTAYN